MSGAQVDLVMVPLKSKPKSMLDVFELVKPLQSLPDFSISDFVIKNFDASKIAGVLTNKRIKAPRASLDLTDDSDPFGLHKEVLFHAFCAWVVWPERKRFIRAATLQAASRVRGRLARNIRATKSNVADSTADFAASYLLTKNGFLPDIYYPAGGDRALRASPSQKTFRARLVKGGEELEHVKRIVAARHYRVENLSGSEYKGPSLEAGVDAVAKRFKKPGKRSLKRLWDRHRASCAFAYAAKGIEVKGKGNFLAEIAAGRASYTRHRRLIDEWFARANYITNAVLTQGPRRDRELKRNSTEPYEFPLAPNSSPIKCSEALMEEGFAEAVRSAFLRKPARAKSTTSS